MNQLLTNMAVSFALAGIIALVYFYVYKENLQEDMVLTLLLLPVVVSVIIFTIGDNVAGAFSLAGIFTIVRFRSTQASPKDITYILLGVGAGLTSAMGIYLEGAVLVIFSVIIILIYETLNPQKTSQRLKILIPEDLVNDKAIEEVLMKYSKNYMLEEVATKDLGSLFELIYRINLPKNIDFKEMIDELRIVNGNLTIKVTK